MRLLAAALALPLLAACGAQAPIAAAAPPLPVPPGCTIDPATRLAVGALPLGDVITSANSLGLPASDVLRLFKVRDGSASAADLAYAQACIGLKLDA